MTKLPWKERVGMLSINPDAASRDDIARMASELYAAMAPLAQKLYELKIKLRTFLAIGAWDFEEPELLGIGYVSAIVDVGVFFDWVIEEEAWHSVGVR